MSKAKITKAPRSIRKAFPQVKTIIDAKRPVIVHVKQKDCDTAEPLNPSECALARAAKREFKVDAVVIGLSTSYLIKGSKATRFNTGTAISREIVSFDRHSDFQPGRYSLSPKAKSNRLHREEKNRTGGKNKNATRKIYHKTTKVREFRIN